MNKLRTLYTDYQAEAVFGSLRSGCRNFVPGEGNPDRPRFMFVGEAPGVSEDRAGRPFVGEAGMVLNRLLADAGINRPDVWITNVLKYRPVDNNFALVSRAQLDMTIEFLASEVKLVDPGTVVLMGTRALQAVFPAERVSKRRGQVLTKGGRRFVPLFHPAVGLHNPGLFPTMVANMRALTSGQTVR